MIRLVVFALALASASPAVAATHEDAQPVWGFSFHLGPYKPALSGEPALYYNKFYTSPNDHSLFKNHPLMMEIEVDYYVMREYGLLGPMLQVGLWGVSGSTKYCVHDGVKGLCSADEILSGQSINGKGSTKLSVYPITLGAIYKLDLIKRYTIIPLVPYAKAGLSWFIWRNTIGGNTSHYLGNAAEGGTLGLRGTVGLAFNLDFIEPNAASRARMSTGIADSYLFGEMSFLWVDGFGDKRRVNFSGQTVQVGFAVDFL